MRQERLITRLLKEVGTRTELYSSLSVDECRRRLKASTDSPWMLFGLKPVVGWSGAGFFRGHKRIWYRNSFQTHAMVSLMAEKTGTQISCRFGMHPLATVFMAIWFAGVVLIGGPITAIMMIAAITGSAVRTSGSMPPLIAAVVAPGMLVFGCALVGFGRWLARDEATFLKDFFLRTLDATEVGERHNVPEASNR
jgi:hypothetical protein